MIKYSGLGHLADVHKELTDPAGGHYPVRRRGEHRELRPNWAGIAWLEAQTLKHTELLGAHAVYDGDRLMWHTRTAARMSDQVSEGAPHHYVRPMIELIDDYHVREEQLSGAQYSTPCPGCDDWSRTARCPEHVERGAATVTNAFATPPAPAPRPATPHLTIDADGVLHARQGDPYDAARNLAQDVRNEFRTFLGGGARVVRPVRGGLLPGLQVHHPPAARRGPGAP